MIELFLSESSQIYFFKDIKNVAYLFQFLPFNEDNEDTAQQDRICDTKFSNLNCIIERTNPISSDAKSTKESTETPTPILKIKEKSRSLGYFPNFDQPGIIIYSLKFIKLKSIILRGCC